MSRASPICVITHAVLLESNLTIRERHTWFGRIEVVGKPGHDLHAHEAPVTVFGIGKLQGGYVRYLNRGMARCLESEARYP